MLAPGRDEIIHTPEGFQAGFSKIVKDSLEAYGRGEPPPVGPWECVKAGRLIHGAYAIAGPARGREANRDRV